MMLAIVKIFADRNYGCVQIESNSNRLNTRMATYKIIKSVAWKMMVKIVVDILPESFHVLFAVL